jgi:hypothetical protein
VSQTRYSQVRSSFPHTNSLLESKEVPMHVRQVLLLALSLSISAASATGQTETQQKVFRVTDGGTSGRMESIFIPPKAGVPFTLTLLTEWSRPLANGGTFTLTNERRIVRDSQGRIYQERWVLVPKGGKIKSRMDIFQITDPARHTWYNCDTEAKVCELLQYSLTTHDLFQPAIGTSGATADGSGFRQVDDLGVKGVRGVDTHGYRVITTINAGEMGNDQPMVTTREFWYSPQLAINLISVVDTPQTSKQVFSVKDLSMSEPDESFFGVPEGYRS